jgi:hypothetical protein
MRRLLSLAVLVLALSASASSQSTGKLQIHYIDVGQGDAAVLISPLGEVVLFDNGVLNQCGKPLAYLQSLGITKIDYHIASHYHSDHIGCTGAVLGMFPLQIAAYDRGGSYTTATYSNYAAAVVGKRVTALKGQSNTGRLQCQPRHHHLRGPQWQRHRHNRRERSFPGVGRPIRTVRRSLRGGSQRRRYGDGGSRSQRSSTCRLRVHHQSNQPLSIGGRRQLQCDREHHSGVLLDCITGHVVGVGERLQWDGTRERDGVSRLEHGWSAQRDGHDCRTLADDQSGRRLSTSSPAARRYLCETGWRASERHGDLQRRHVFLVAESSGHVQQSRGKEVLDMPRGSVQWPHSGA